MIKDAILNKWLEHQNNKIYQNKCELEQAEAKHFVRNIEQNPKAIGFSITTPVSVEFKIDFEAEDDEEAVMIITNKFNNEKFVRPLPSTVNSEEDQLKCHRGILDIEAEEYTVLTN